MKLVKLGGSVLTDKTALYSLRRGALNRLAAEIAEAGEQIVLVHGAGSFGHVVAHYFQLMSGTDAGARPEIPPELTPHLPLGEDTSQVWGMARVHRDMRKLNLEVVDALAEHHLSPVGLSPSDLFCCDQGQLVPNGNVSLFSDLLESGFLPVTYGDGVLDKQRGFSICSGDHLMPWLAEHLEVDEAIFVSDVDGVFSGPPGEEGVHLVEHVTAEVEATLRARAATVGEGVYDVTDGILGKIQSCFEVAARGVPVTFLNGTVEGRLSGALRGEKVPASRFPAAVSEL